MLKLNPDAHDIRLKYIRQKASQPGQELAAQTEFMRLEAALRLKFERESGNLDSETLAQENERLKTDFGQLNFVVQANLPQLSLGDFIQFRLAGSNGCGSMGIGKKEASSGRVYSLDAFINKKIY